MTTWRRGDRAVLNGYLVMVVRVNPTGLVTVQYPDADGYRETVPTSALRRL